MKSDLADKELKEKHLHRIEVVRGAIDGQRPLLKAEHRPTELLDGKQSVVFDEGFHVQAAIVLTTTPPKRLRAMFSAASLFTAAMVKRLRRLLMRRRTMKVSRMGGDILLKVGRSAGLHVGRLFPILEGVGSRPQTGTNVGGAKDHRVGVLRIGDNVAEDRLGVEHLLFNVVTNTLGFLDERENASFVTDTNEGGAGRVHTARLTPFL